MKHRPLHLTIELVPCVLLAGCGITEGRVESVVIDLDVATQANHRGMPQNERGVLLPALAVGLPTRADGLLDLSTSGIVDLADSTGDAWFPDGHRGRFGEIDFKVAWSRTFAAIDATFGVENYNLQDGQEFVDGPAQEARGSTSELFAATATELLGVEPFAELHYDFVEAQGAYLRGGLAKGLALADRWRVEATVALGWSSAAQSRWNYGLREAGWSDLSATTALLFDWDRGTTLELGVGASRVVDPTLRDWFDLIGIEKDNAWISAGIRWTF